MDKRQVFHPPNPLIFIIFMAILAWISACQPLTPITSTPTSPPPISTTTNTPWSALTVPPSTPEKCTETRGQVQGHVFDSVALPSFQIYLPPCYDSNNEKHYPILYLLHGANYADDQWIRLGIEDEAPFYIIVMPHEKYSLKSIDETEFGRIFIEEFIPYIDKNYQTLTNTKYRAIGGLSRGGGWAIHYGLTHWGTFGSFGAHSPAIFHQDYTKLDDWLEKIPTDNLPRIYIDTGDKDPDYIKIAAFSSLLAEKGIPHKWRLYAGMHDEVYWRTHLPEYLDWYGEAWK